MNEELFKEELIKMGIVPTEKELSLLKNYCEELLIYNKKVNLTALKTKEEVYLKHFYDSLTIIKGYHFTSESVLDIGTGAGFPGLVLKIFFPDIKLTLLDSNHKKTDFLKYISDKLKINVEIVNNRAEIFFQEGRTFDIVVSRAVANLIVLSELSIPFCKVSGYFIAMKGDSSEELKVADYAIKFLGGNVNKVISFSLPLENSIRTLIKIQKEKLTPDAYPRSYDKILKKPLKKDLK